MSFDHSHVETLHAGGISYKKSTYFCSCAEGEAVVHFRALKPTTPGEDMAVAQTAAPKGNDHKESSSGRISDRRSEALTQRKINAIAAVHSQAHPTAQLQKMANHFAANNLAAQCTAMYGFRQERETGNKEKKREISGNKEKTVMPRPDWRL